MNIEVLFKNVVHELKVRRHPFAVAGGLAISLYRFEPRTTQDIDLLILIERDALGEAQEILQSIGLTPQVVREADLKGGPLFTRKAKSSPPQIVVGRFPDRSEGLGVDFILPAMPWFRSAFERAQHHCINFGFGPIPTVTVEDMIIAKLSAFQDSPRRFKDLDDLQSVFKKQQTFDFEYLGAQMRELKLRIPKEIRPDVPKILIQISRA